METVATPPSLYFTPELVFRADGMPPVGYAGFYALRHNPADALAPSDDIYQILEPGRCFTNSYVLIPDILPGVDVPAIMKRYSRIEIVETMKELMERSGWVESTGPIPSEFFCNQRPRQRTISIWLIADDTDPANLRWLEPGPGVYTLNAAEHPEQLEVYHDVTKLRRALSVQFHADYGGNPGKKWAINHQSSDVSYAYATGDGGEWVFEQSPYGVARYLWARFRACLDIQRHAIYFPDENRSKYGQLRGNEAWHINMLYRILNWDIPSKDIQEDTRIQIDALRHENLKTALFASGIFDERLVRIEQEKIGAYPDEYTFLIPGYETSVKQFTRKLEQYIPVRPPAFIFEYGYDRLTLGELELKDLLPPGAPITEGDIIEVRTGTTMWIMRCQKLMDSDEMEVVGVHGTGGKFGHFKARVLYPKPGEPMHYTYYAKLEPVFLENPLLDRDTLQMNIGLEIRRLYAKYGEMWQKHLLSKKANLDRQNIFRNFVIRMDTDPVDEVRVKTKRAKSE